MNYTTADQPKSLRRFMPYVWVLGLLTLVASVGGTGWILRTQAADKNSKDDKTPTASSSDSMVVGIGSVDVKRGLVSLYPHQMGAVVTDILVEESTKVAKGSPLLKVDDRAAKLTLARAEADLTAAEAVLSQAKKAPEAHALDISMQKKAIDANQLKLDDAKDKLERMKMSNRYEKAQRDEAEIGVKMLELAVKADQEKLAKLQLDDPQVTLTKAQSDVEAKRGQRDLAQLAVDECVLKAPVDGSVERIQTTVGDIFGSPTKQAAMLFCPEGPRIIRLEIEQEFANRLKVGQSATIQDDTTSAGSWHGKVARISDIYAERRTFVQGPFQFNDVRNLECIIELDPNQEPLRIFQRVRVTLRNP
jgi:multidrug resistance efflux pump